MIRGIGVAWANGLAGGVATAPGLVTAICCILVALLVHAGCGSQERTSERPPQRLTTDADEMPRSLDPCATRLHDLSGALLLSWFREQVLPDDILGLISIDTGEPIPAVCPVTGGGYVYDPTGIHLPEVESRVILYDSRPHNGYRWAIVVREGAGEGALVLDVIALPERFFLFRRQ